MGLVTVIPALIFLFVRPGPLRYEIRSAGPGCERVHVTTVRIDRITQRVSLWDAGKGQWRKL